MMLLTQSCRHSILSLITGLFLSFAGIGQNWVSIAGISGNDIGIGRNGSVWITAQDGSIHRWNGSAFERMSGGAVRIAVDPSGAAWVVNAGKQIFKYNLGNNNWDLINGEANDVGVGADGSVWIIGNRQVPGGFNILKYTGSGWSEVPGGALRIAVDPQGNPWVVNNTNNVFRFNGTAFESLPGSVKDVGIGADGSVWCLHSNGNVHKWEGSNWSQKSGGAENIAVTPAGDPWVINSGGIVYRSGPAVVIGPMELRQLFPRGETAEWSMLRALRVSPYGEMSGNNPQPYAQLDAFGKALGRLALTAAEIHYSTNPNISGTQALGQIGPFTSPETRQAISGILAVLVMGEHRARPNGEFARALNDWSTRLFRGAKVRTAKSLLDEYDKWKTDFCSYEGLSDAQCRVESQGMGSLFTSRTPPQDLMARNSLASVMSGYPESVAVGVATALSAITIPAAFASLTAVLGPTTAAGVTTMTSLATAFGATVGSKVGILSSGALGAAGWAGVVAAPVAAVVMAIVVGTIEGFKVVEAAKVEPMLKQKLGAAMTDPINITNMIADEKGREMYFMSFMEAAANQYRIPDVKVNGEVRFYCQAGYISQFRLSYNLGSEQKQETTRELPVGQEQSFTIPWNATNIRVQGWWKGADMRWNELFNQTLPQPTYRCYTSYGTIFGPNFKNDCPEVGAMTTQANQLTVTHGGGYVARVVLTYTQGGQTRTVINNNSLSLGWRQVVDIPADATNIKLEAWSNTGLAWDLWKSILSRTWPSPPNECIKIFGTTLDPKWNNECR